MVNAAELQTLVETVARGDEDAFERLYAGTSAKLYGTVLRILRRSDLAREVMEDTYASVWHRRGEFVSSGEPPMTRLVAIARERALDTARNRTKDTADEAATTDAATEDASSVDRQDLTEGLRKLLACLGELGPERRRLILLAYYGGWTRAQLAAKFATDVENVGLWLRGSLMQLRECLGS
jgi:RNA polymerase sigma-70 factor, ECF subfamily